MQKEAKRNFPNQNAINVCNLEISDLAKSLLSKGPLYVPSPNDINWYKLKKDFDSFVNKLRKHCNQSQFSTTKDKDEERLEQSVDRFGPAPSKTKEKYTILEQSQFITTHLKTLSKCLRLISLDMIIIKEFAITFQLWNVNPGKNCILYTAKTPVISPNFLVWKFFGEVQLPHSFGRFA